MKDFLKRNTLHFVVFTTGAFVLMVEVVAIRILSPYFGNTIYTVSSVISVILAALSLGYYFGGRYSDRHPSHKIFYGIIALSGLSVILLRILMEIALPIIGAASSLTTGPLVSSVVLFFAPSFLLGTLSPYAIKLQKVSFPDMGVGKISGAVFFWSTLGSILGSLAAGFILIPNLGISKIITSIGVALVAMGVIALFLKKEKAYTLSKIVIIALIGLGVAYSVSTPSDPSVVFRDDGVYERIIIRDAEYKGRPARFFIQDRSSSGAIFLDSEELVFDYTKYYSIYPLFKEEVNSVLAIGGGAYSIPKAIAKEIPNARVDVVEIEPSLYKLAKKYFYLEDNPNLQNHVTDGRRFLHSSQRKYDLIFSDVYYSLFSIPSHFTTKEFFGVAKSKLNKDGIFIANIIGDLSRTRPSLILSEMKTLMAVFPNSYFFATESPTTRDTQNFIFVGHNSESKIDISPSVLQRFSGEIIQSLDEKLIDLGRFSLEPHTVLTDDFAPIETMTAAILKRNLKATEVAPNGEEMLVVVEQLLSYGPRYLGSDGHKRAENFILSETSALADEVTHQRWSHTSKDGSKEELTNIIARFNPERKNRVIIGTHYDSKRFADEDRRRPDQPVPGANDSASGAAVLIEIARYFSEVSRPQSVGIDLVFFDGEEGEENADSKSWYPLGSTYFSENLDSIYASKPGSAIIVDMVCDKDLRITRELSSIEDAPIVTEKFWEAASKVDSKTFSESNREGWIRDDHTPLNEAGIPSTLIIDIDYPHWHTTKDTLDKCSAKSLETVANSLIGYLSSLQY